MGVGKHSKYSVVTDHCAVFFHSYKVMYTNENSHHKIFMEPVSEKKPREDPGMSKGSSGQHGGLCLRGHQGRILGCPGGPPTAWRPVSERTPREDPGMSRGSSGQHGGLCLRGHHGRIPGCPRDPPDSMGACV